MSSLIDGNIGSFILNLALLALGLYSGLVIISYRHRFINELVLIYSSIVTLLLYSGSWSLTPVTMWSQSRWTCLATGTRKWPSWDPGPAPRGIPKCEWFFALLYYKSVQTLQFVVQSNMIIYNHLKNWRSRCVALVSLNYESWFTFHSYDSILLNLC